MTWQDDADSVATDPFGTVYPRRIRRPIDLAGYPWPDNSDTYLTALERGDLDPDREVSADV